MTEQTRLLQKGALVAQKKAKTQQFARRKPNLIKKADQLARLCHADVALIIRRNGRYYYTYRSIDHERWPPHISEIVSSKRIHRLYINISQGKFLPDTYQPPIAPKTLPFPQSTLAILPTPPST